MWFDLCLGLLFSLLIAGAAYGKRSLSGSGAAAAVVVGTVLYTWGGLPWYGTLLVFFLTSTLLTKWRHRQKASVESGYAKSGRRDAGQVLANGGLGMLFCIGHSLWPHPLWWAAYLGVMATVNADTWATEIGGSSRQIPRSIVNGRKVPAGTSGGITVLGLVASLAGGLVIGIFAWFFIQWSTNAAETGSITYASSGIGQLLLLGVVGGLVGSLADSWLGAVWQVMYRCADCGKEIEKNRHCNSQAVRVRGASFMTNDAVNMISSLFGGAVCVGLYATVL
ncbi:DUF92 domain-containing protein [Paenibacillus sp. LMG 31456]|uniref:DUF92 domain-containing protein n=1 Tax=Paenibacillus foliorum TaxID=2654974 RepID=A0A972GWL6_9BACL|nr:DUF92 domain-containing protein [Paenibacillus foliorum]NOU97977.1 DUF92 domain-containing protein [Paenibacillus foliorum]